MFNIGTAMQSLDIGRQLDAYTGVIIHAGQDDDGNAIDYSAGNNSGYVLEFDNPIGTQQMADAILANLKLRGVRYQPFEADTAEIDPACEIGDGVIVNGTESVIMSIDSDHSQKMSSTISAPLDEEVDHEFQYEPRTTREFKRETAYARSRISQTANEIALEVARATASEGELSGRITVQADRITSEVTRATNSEGALSSRITQTSDAITSEVTRATGAESSLSSRITQTSDAITSEVTRATAAEGNLGTRIDQRLDSITLAVTSASGSSTFTIKDGSTTLDTKTLNLTVESANISGRLTAAQIDATSLHVSAANIDGTLTASQISVSDLSALGATIAGWSITSSEIRKRVDQYYDTALYAPSSPNPTSYVFYTRTWVDGAWQPQFYVTYNGAMFARNATISGTITATAGTIGGVTISNGVLSGINDTNIQTGGISGGSGGSIGSGTITTDNTTSGINTSLGYANFANGVFNNTNTANYISASSGYITYLHATNTLWIGSARCYLGSVEIDGVNYNVVRYYT